MNLNDLFSSDKKAVFQMVNNQIIIGNLIDFNSEFCVLDNAKIDGAKISEITICRKFIVCFWQQPNL